jgi:hypothetical protein
MEDHTFAVHLPDLPNSEDTLIAPTDPAVTQSDSDFQKLPAKDYELHLWGDSLPEHANTMQRNRPPPGTNKINHLRSSLNNQLLNAEM